MNRLRFAHLLKATVLALSLISLLPAAVMAQGMPPTLVELGEVSELEFHDQMTLVGRTSPWIRSQMVAEVAGRVTAIEAAEGNPVSRGEVLVRISDDKAKAQLAAKSAEVEQARISADLALTNFKRAEDLFAKNLIREATLDSMKAWVASANARHAQLDAEREQLQIDFDRCTIRAPFNGFTVQQLVQVGGWVSPGTPVFELVDLTSIKVTVDLPERHYGRVSIGSAALIRSAGEDDQFDGMVTGIGRDASEETHTFPIMVTVDNPEMRLGGGKLVRATLSFDEKFTSLAVSKDAVLRQGTQTSVYTVADGKAVPIAVTIRSEMGDMVAVEGEGLKIGMPVVVRGNERIFPGSSVQVANINGGAPTASPN
ncbi:MAG: efflux RND transporter periplasmic adaptor subunit [Candidatus Zixiibacteriota bacterium]